MWAWDRLAWGLRQWVLEVGLGEPGAWAFLLQPRQAMARLWEEGLHWPSTWLRGTRSFQRAHLHTPPAAHMSPRQGQPVSTETSVEPQQHLEIFRNPRETQKNSDIPKTPAIHRRNSETTPKDKDRDAGSTLG